MPNQWGLKNTDPGFQFSGQQISPDEIDEYRQYVVTLPADGTAFHLGTTAAGTATQAKAMVIVNKKMDYPRNLAGAIEGTGDIGGVWVVNGKDQFGIDITETFTVGTADNGGTTGGTMIFAEISTGTCTFSADSVGGGTPTLQYQNVGTSVKFGLPARIGGTADVKSITWTDELVSVPINGGTIGAYVGTGGSSGFNSWFRGTEVVDGTQTYTVVYKPTYNASALSTRTAGL